MNEENRLDLAAIMEKAVAAYLQQAIPSKAMERKTQPPEMISIDECCKRTKLSRQCVRYGLIPENKIKYIKAGRRILINWDSVLDFLAVGDGAGTEAG